MENIQVWPEDGSRGGIKQFLTCQPQLLIVVAAVCLSAATSAEVSGLTHTHIWLFALPDAAWAQRLRIMRLLH